MLYFPVRICSWCKWSSTRGSLVRAIFWRFWTVLDILENSTPAALQRSAAACVCCPLNYLALAKAAELQAERDRSIMHHYRTLLSALFLSLPAFLVSMILPYIPGFYMDVTLPHCRLLDDSAL
jgi:hypothetical protein